jgi:hypothetical protein
VSPHRLSNNGCGRGVAPILRRLAPMDQGRPELEQNTAVSPPADGARPARPIPVLGPVGLILAIATFFYFFL